MAKCKALTGSAVKGLIAICSSLWCVSVQMTEVVSDIQDDDSDTSFQQNVNIFHENYMGIKENPLYSSNTDIAESSVGPDGSSSHSESIVDDDDDLEAPAKHPRQQAPVSYSKVRVYTLCLKKRHCNKVADGLNA